MTKGIDKPRIVLLSSGIQFTRAENQIASLETRREQDSIQISLKHARVKHRLRSARVCIYMYRAVNAKYGGFSKVPQL
jgi:hypothetical protein